MDLPACRCARYAQPEQRDRTTLRRRQSDSQHPEGAGFFEPNVDRNAVTLCEYKITKDAKGAFQRTPIRETQALRRQLNKGDGLPTESAFQKMEAPDDIGSTFTLTGHINDLQEAYETECENQKVISARARASVEHNGQNTGHAFNPVFYAPDFQGRERVVRPGFQMDAVILTDGASSMLAREHFPSVEVKKDENLDYVLYAAPKGAFRGFYGIHHTPGDDRSGIAPQLLLMIGAERRNENIISAYMLAKPGAADTKINNPKNPGRMPDETLKLLRSHLPDIGKIYAKAGGDPAQLHPANIVGSGRLNGVTARYTPRPVKGNLVCGGDKARSDGPLGGLGGSVSLLNDPHNIVSYFNDPDCLADNPKAASAAEQRFLNASRQAAQVRIGGATAMEENLGVISGAKAQEVLQMLATG